MYSIKLFKSMLSFQYLYHQSMQSFIYFIFQNVCTPDDESPNLSHGPMSKIIFHKDRIQLVVYIFFQMGRAVSYCSLIHGIPELFYR
jgi:hypothetical protein